MQLNKIKYSVWLHCIINKNKQILIAFFLKRRFIIFQLHILFIYLLTIT